MVCVSFMKYWFEKNYTIKQPAFDSATQSRTQLSHKALYFEWRCGCNHTLASELYLCSNPMQTPLIECNKFPPEAISSSAKITWNYHLSNSWQSMWRECELTKNSKLQRFITKQYFENHKLIISNNVMSIWAWTPPPPPTHPFKAAPQRRFPWSFFVILSVDEALFVRAIISSRFQLHQ